MKKVLAGLAAGALAMGIFSSSSFAAVTVDELGNGFVGKGDVQQALGWNNAQLQKEAGSLVFSYESVDTYEITVEWTNPNNGKKEAETKEVVHNRNSFLTSSVDYKAREAKQYTGFNLTGFTATASTGDIPSVGDEFPGKSGHKVTNVSLVSSKSTLKVNGVPLQ